MTKAQLELLDFIKVYIATKRYSPTFEEMRQELGLASKSQVARLIGNLEEQGKIRRLHRRKRAIEVVENPVLPAQLESFSTADLAREAKRRNLVLGHIFSTRSDAGNGTVIVKRTFKAIDA